jgi:hypothetical protein
MAGMDVVLDPTWTIVSGPPLGRVRRLTPELSASPLYFVSAERLPPSYGVPASRHPGHHDRDAVHKNVTGHSHQLKHVTVEVDTSAPIPIIELAVLRYV